MRNLSFAGRLILVAFTPAMLVAVMMSLFFIVNSVLDSEKSEIQKALTLAQALARAAEFGVATNNQVVLQEAAQPVLAVSSIFAVKYLNSAKTVIYHRIESDHQFGDISAFARFARNLFSDQALISQVNAEIQRTDLTLYEDPLFEDPKNRRLESPLQTIGYIELDVDLSLAYEDQYATIRRVFLFVGLVLLIALTAAYRLAQSVIVPVRSLSESVRSLARNEYVSVLPLGKGGELDELARGMNFLSAELQSFHAMQSDAIKLATEDLQNTLTLLETKNSELEQARATAETASAFKSQFVANVSHEIRTPLNVIIGTLSVMNKSDLDLTHVDQFDMIMNSSNTLLYLIEDILDISKIESGNLVVETISTNLEGLLAEVTSSVAMQAVDKGIELYVAPLPDLSLRDAYTDPFRVKQVLSNLLTNAIKFTQSGHISLSTEILESHRGYRQVLFTVEDTGIGIPIGKQEALFSAFTQVDMSTTRRYGGTGLGLFICKGIVELLGGSIGLNSEEGVGTRIEVTLPFKVSTASAPDIPTLYDSVEGVVYSDNYEPLQSLNLRLLNLVLNEVLNKDAIQNIPPICITNISNHMLANSWTGTIDPIVVPAPAMSEVSGQADNAHLAWVSQITPQIESRLMHAGYTGYVVKTPSLVQLKRNVQVALSGQCFKEFAGDSLLDDRPKNSFQTLTILAVDDQSLNIDLLMQYFEYLNVRGIYASSGQEALACVAAESIDMVLLDLHMPIQDGFQVAERIRNSGGINAQIPIIAMTADAYQTTREKALSTGFDDLLTKPATVQQISEVISRWVKPHSFEEPVKVGPLIDIKACAAAVRGDEEWAKGAMKTYGIEIPGHIDNIRKAMQAKNAKALFEAAHAVKGVSRLFQINQIANCAEALEKQCSGADWVKIEAIAYELKSLLQSAEKECNALPA
ncbi:hybrid sensor histidine kinase/response regulator [Granulosicoccus antarcticus]|uniref:histidine kinase n=1 Tax=Granulosicoccus antarcticus IMCC3135 TaxID=1192854 RepID=A0A2Z2NLE9_9GAMM|nr:hybrid sensor histidine kinase/response regulator [Granulosicoccus antarcticus]ASJ70801.1 Signal transduction histidine-protein kinase BarA [Granulosicoccus antarcticus IMCC3135]